MSETTKQEPIDLQTSESMQRQQAPATIEMNSIASSLRHVVANAKDMGEIFRDVTDIICRETDCLALWVAQRDPAQNTIQLHTLTDENADAVSDLAGDELNFLILQTFLSGELGSIEINRNHSLAASVIGGEGNQSNMVFAGCFEHSNQSMLRQQWMITMATLTIERWLKQNELIKTKAQLQFVGESLSLCGVLDQSTSKREAANYLVNQLRRLLNVKQVVYCDGTSQEKASLTAISEVEQFDPHSESSRVIFSAASLGIGSAEPIVFSATTTVESTHSLPLEAYCKANRFSSCVCVPIQDYEGNPTGSILVGSSEASFSEAQISQLQQFASINGTHLDIVRRANLGPAEMVKERLFGVTSKSWFRLAKKITVVVAIVMLVPIPYRIACDCEIQPVTRRFVSAPYTGPLERSVVRPGEVVKKDQILAYMDGRQLRLELAGVEAEHQAAKRQHSSALAKGEVAQSQIAQSESRKLKSRLKSLKDQLERLEIRSPYDGIVISGDLEKAQGATMEIGQTLFEVAPLDAMLAEVAIPESEIQYVEESDSVAIKLNAFPYRTFYGQIDTVHPSAEVIDDESVFVADVKLTDDDNLIRPGMKGTGKVSTVWRPVGWNLFHNAWESVRCWLIW